MRIVSLLAITLVAAQARAVDITSTLMHYYVTHGYDARLSIERAELAGEILQVDAPDMDDVPHMRLAGFLNYDVQFLPDDLGQVVYYSAGGKAAWHTESGFDSALYYGGTWLVFDDSDHDDRVLNMFVGGRAGGRWFTVAADLGVNFMSTTETQDSMDFKELFGLDRFNAFAEIPALKLVGRFEYDLGTKEPHNVEVTWSHDLRGAGLGVLTLGYAHRFAYPVTGLFRRNDFDALAVPHYEIAADMAGLLRLERIRLFAGDGFALLGTVGAAAGTTEGALRYGYGELTAAFSESVGVYANVGRAYARVEEEHQVGFGAGIEGIYEWFVGRVGGGVREWDFVDRVGGPDRPVLRIDLSFKLDRPLTPPSSGERFGERSAEFPYAQPPR